MQVSIVIGADGAIKSARVTSGFPLLRNDTLDIVKGWRFQPGTINGVPTEMEARATLLVTTMHAALPVPAILPAYPAEARNNQVSGVVHLRALVSPDGAVASVEAVGGPEILRQASTDAVRRWKYEPSAATGQAGMPVDIVFSMTRHFRGDVTVVGALIPPGGPFPRPKPGVVPPRLR